jgi:transcriptional regulator with XRE-family HTH domain
MLKEFGADLKKLRELKGISIAEISAESRINPKFLLLIENGKFDFQPETYIRSFIKAYARSLDENENQILNDYDKAKAGFYARRKFASEENKEALTADEKLRISVQPPPVENRIEEPVYSKSIRDDKPDYMKPRVEEEPREFSGRPVMQKILLVILIIAIGAGIYFLVDYLNNSGDKKSDVKPKSFKEISSDYENKISGKIDSARIKDSLSALITDSLKLKIKALRDIKVKIYVDDAEEPIDEEMSAKDTLIIMAKENSGSAQMLIQAWRYTSTVTI